MRVLSDYKNPSRHSLIFMMTFRLTKTFRDELDKEDIFYNLSPGTINARNYTISIETKRRHAIEQRDNCLKRVHELELQLGVVQRWVPGSAEWNAATAKTVLCEYRKAVDNLEGLVVSRLFELLNLNKSQIREFYIINFVLLGLIT